MKLEVLHVADCPNLPVLLERLREVTDLPVVTHQIDTHAEANDHGMAGSPTLLVDGVDLFAASDRGEYGVSCRIYRGERDEMVAAPSVQQLRKALDGVGPAQVLSRWRTRAQPLEPVERAVHNAILRAFATTGRAPAAADLDAVTAGTGTRAQAVLAWLHDCDAIRLGPDGQIVVAYPFSATQTRHRVRIGGQIDVYAMCAIDALGIAAMTGRDTEISSVDVTSGREITVVTRAGQSSWEPPGAVVFVGATADDAASADCCCSYLNFFTDTDAAEAWASSQPQVPGQILSQAEAEQLGTDLFGRLLAV